MKQTQSTDQYSQCTFKLSCLSYVCFLSVDDKMFTTSQLLIRWCLNALPAVGFGIGVLFVLPSENYLLCNPSSCSSTGRQQAFGPLMDKCNKARFIHCLTYRKIAVNSKNRQDSIAGCNVSSLKYRRARVMLGYAFLTYRSRQAGQSPKVEITGAHVYNLALPECNARMLKMVAMSKLDLLARCARSQ